MNLSEAHAATIKDLLTVEHAEIALKLRFISDNYNSINDDLLRRSVSMIDELSRSLDERSKKIVVIAASILWEYRKAEWDGLREFLVLALTRAGFPPSAIMLDHQYDQDECKFTGSNSLINELAITAYQINHEIFINDKKFLITDFQKRVWESMAKVKLLGISAPTSAGKSFIILLKAVEAILKGDGNIIYIVPTLSLVAQVSSDFNQQLKSFGIKNYRISTTYNLQDVQDKKIYVLTQEKAISAFSQVDEPYRNIKMLIVDEIQNIERVSSEDDQRAKTLYDSLIEFRHTCKPELIVISGPRVDGLKKLGFEIFDQKLVDEVKTTDSPVASITYAISSSSSGYDFNQYADVLRQPNKIKITNYSVISGYGKSQYTDAYIEYLSQFVSLLGDDSKNIIFSPTKDTARKIALKLSDLKSSVTDDDKIISLIKYIKDTVHEDYDMCKALEKGFVYHHGSTPPHVRAVIERAVRDKIIQNVVCTTTLMQGVNLPAQNVILRNPDLAIKNRRDGEKPRLSDYEIANLRGRAGRLLKDFIGRTYVLDEDSFEREESQLNLFPDAEKTLSSGYADKFTEYRGEILSSLESGLSIDDKQKEFGFLVTYIRQMILRHREKCSARLRSVGIEITEDKIRSISESMRDIEVPVEVCFKNRYWDPLDLNEMYLKRQSFKLPSSVSDRNLVDSLENLLLGMKRYFNVYYQRHFGVNEAALRPVCINASNWIKETPLSKILSSSYFDDQEKIERAITGLQSNISFGMTMLLKPIYDINMPESMFLKFIETGAYRPITRKMIELNIPRETAIYIERNFFSDFKISDGDMDGDILRRLAIILPELDYWVASQIEAVV